MSPLSLNMCEYAWNLPPPPPPIFLVGGGGEVKLVGGVSVINGAYPACGQTRIQPMRFDTKGFLIDSFIC